MATSDTNQSPTSKPYRLGVALSGGGARGLAHAGALEAIEEAGLKPEIIAGVSAGSVVAVLYAAGVKPRRILDMFTLVSVHDLTELTIGKGGLIKIDKFARYIARSLGQYKRLEDLHIPTYVGVTNLDVGVAEEFHEGTIQEIVKASCSIPIVFPPVVINGTKYVDGGVLRNLPAWTIRDKCDTLIGINVSPMIKEKVKNNSILDIAMRSYTLMTKSNQNADMQMCDLTIETREISHHKVFSLKEITKVYNSGYINMRKALRDKGWWHPELADPNK